MPKTVLDQLRDSVINIGERLGVDEASHAPGANGYYDNRPKTDLEIIRDTAEALVTAPDEYQYKVIRNVETASFSDGVNAPVKYLLASIEPVQSGAGDPSPTNIRPITGWTGMHVYVSPTSDPADGHTYSVDFPAQGKNLMPNKTLQRNPTSVWVGQDTAGGFPIHMDAGETYTFSFTHNGSSEAQTYYQYSVGSMKLFGTGNSPTFTAPKDMDVRFFVFVPGGVTEVTNFMLEKGSTATTYEAYTNTVYGGAVNLTTGLLTVTKGMIASYNGETLPSDWISDRDVYAAGTTPTTGAQVVYTLATPISYPVNPVTVSTLSGTNRMWTDTGKILVLKYPYTE